MKDIIFKMEEKETVEKIFNGKAIFIKFFDVWNIHPSYKKTILVGNKEGVSASILGGSNIGINKYISNKRKKEAIEVLKFITSYDIQKFLVINYKIGSGINALYDDDEVCQVYHCNIAKDIQFIARPSALTNDYDEYSRTLRKYLNEFLYGDKDAVEALNEINDITRIYDIPINYSESSVGFIIFILTIVIMLIILSSLIFLFIKKSKEYYNFFSLDLWIIIFTGYIITLFYVFTEYGEVKRWKCHLKYLFISLGLTLIFIPMLYKLLVNFPYNDENNKFFGWINQKKNKIIFISFFLIYEIIFQLLLIIPSYEIKYHYIHDGKNYETCEINKLFGYILISFIIIEKIIILLLISLLIFMEWNILNSLTDIKLAISSIYITFLILIVSFLYKLITINNYLLYFIIKSSLINLFVLSHFFFFYEIRIFLFLFDNKNKNIIEMKPESAVTTSNISNEQSKNKSYIENNRKSKILSVIMNYHNYTGEGSENKITYSDN